MNKKENMPTWAYWGLWGINSRKVAMAFVVVTALIALVLIPIGIIVNDYLLLTFIFVPIWYWVSIKWADKNSAWPTTEVS